MKSSCYYCGNTLKDGPLFRQYPKGQYPIWACKEHNKFDVAPEVRDIINIIEEANKGVKS